jgi:excisionase family DNA binding protein
MSRAGVYQYCMASSTLLTPRQAAEKLGISYPALKHWILAGRIQTIKTPGEPAIALIKATEVMIGRP